MNKLEKKNTDYMERIYRKYNSSKDEFAKMIENILKEKKYIYTEHNDETKHIVVKYYDKYVLIELVVDSYYELLGIFNTSGMKEYIKNSEFTFKKGDLPL